MGSNKGGTNVGYSGEEISADMNFYPQKLEFDHYELV